MILDRWTQRGGLLGTAVLAAALLVCLSWGAGANSDAALARADQRALAATPEDEANLDRLAHYLCPRSFTEWQKARSVFRWVGRRVTYDVTGLRNGKLHDQSALTTLRTRIGVCEGYSHLFAELASRAGLQVTYVVGESKFNDSLGFRLPPGVKGHGWNAVQLGGRWRLLDPTWAAGHLDKGRFVREWDDYWFCPPPEQFIYTHLPAEERWQLLQDPLTPAAFADLPRLNSEFFRLGLRLQPGDLSVLQCGGERRVQLSSPPDVVVLADLREEGGQPLSGRVFTQSPGGRPEVRLRAPKPGRYRLRLFARRRAPAWQADVEHPESYREVSEHTVRASRGTTLNYPKTYGSFERGGAELVRPQLGTLAAGSEQQFTLRAPGATDVALFCRGDKVAMLEGSNGMWSGKFRLPAQGPVQLCARYPQEHRYWGMVEYQLTRR